MIFSNITIYQMYIGVLVYLKISLDLITKAFPPRFDRDLSITIDGYFANMSTPQRSRRIYLQYLTAKRE